MSAPWVFFTGKRQHPFPFRPCPGKSSPEFGRMFRKAAANHLLGACISIIHLLPPLQPKIGEDFDAYTIFALYKYKKQGGYTALLWS